MLALGAETNGASQANMVVAILYTAQEKIPSRSVTHI